MLEKTELSWESTKSRTHSWSSASSSSFTFPLIHLPSHTSCCFVNYHFTWRFSCSVRPEQAGWGISAMSRSSRSLPCPQAHLPPRSLALLRHHWCQNKVKTPQGQFQTTELSFNHVFSTNVRRNYMAKSLQAILDTWKLILQLLLGQRNRTACCQQLTETGRAERDEQLEKTHPLHYPPRRMTILLAQDILLSPLVQRIQGIAHTPALLPSRERWGCRIAVRILYTSSFLPLKHLGNSVPGQVTASDFTS